MVWKAKKVNTSEESRWLNMNYEVLEKKERFRNNFKKLIVGTGDEQYCLPTYRKQQE